MRKTMFIFLMGLVLMIGFCVNVYAVPGYGCDCSATFCHDGVTKSSRPSTCPTDAPPVPDLIVRGIAHVGEEITLDAGQSYDPEGQPLSYEWVFTPPIGSSAIIVASNPSGSLATFVIDEPGVYAAYVRVSDGINPVEPSDPVSISVAMPICGDGYQDPAEACDDGNDVVGDGCTPNCTIDPYCGDGIVDPDEACDDDNNANGDGCSADCNIEVCGDGFVNNNGTEECDDGNTNDNDGCSATCITEFCGDSTVNNTVETCDDGNTNAGDGCSADCIIEVEVPSPPVGPICGNGILETGEACDDGNNYDNDACLADCTLAPFCGNGNVDPGEECDGTVGCLADCTTEEVPVPPTGPVCGDGILDPGEVCDDGNTAEGDACSVDCLTIEITCGNGVPNPGEECDDGNDINGDGCAADCTTETLPDNRTYPRGDDEGEVDEDDDKYKEEEEDDDKYKEDEEEDKDEDDDKGKYEDDDDEREGSRDTRYDRKRKYDRERRYVRKSRHERDDD